MYRFNSARVIRAFEDVRRNAVHESQQISGKYRTEDRILLIRMVRTIAEDMIEVVRFPLC